MEHDMTRAALSRAVVESLEHRQLLSGVSFQPHVDYTVAGDPKSVVTADVNGDSKLDIIVGDQTPYSTHVSILLGNGNGTFKTSTTTSVGIRPDIIQTADLNGDGKADLIITNYNNQTADVLLGNGNGTFKTPIGISGASSVYKFFLADINGDGTPDFVYDHAIQVNTSYCGVLLGNGNGTFKSSQDTKLTNNDSLAAIADFNGDGKADVVVTNVFSHSVGILFGNGNGTFKAENTFAADSFPGQVVALDLNGDGKNDLVISDGFGGSVILLNNGSGGFGASSSGPNLTNELLSTADINGDGKLDVVSILAANLGQGYGDYVTVSLNSGSGTLQTPQTFASYHNGSINSVAFGDFSGDGKTDIVACNGSRSSVSVLINSTSVAPPFAVLNNGILTITGTSNADSILVTDASGSVSATLNDLTEGPFTGVTGITCTGGAGDDTISLAGVPINSTLGGAGGNDSISGGAANDSIKGGAGNDSLGGAAGADTIVGGGNDDSIKGGSGDDDLLGGPGNDTIHGGVGNDTIFGGAGNDVDNGNDGNDSIFAGAGSSTLAAGPGNDTLLGSVNAGDQPDSVICGTGADSVELGSGDSISGQTGQDTVQRLG